MKTSICLLVAAFAAVHAYAEPEIKGTPTELTAYLQSVPRTVSLLGEAELKIAADRALVSLMVVTEHKSLQEALRANQELRAKIASTLQERGLPADRVKPSKFSSTPKYGVFAEKAKSYRVENVMKISTLDEKEFQAVANLVDSMPEVRYDNIEFMHSDKEALKTKVLTQAIEKVEERRHLYESKLGVKLVPKTFMENPVTAQNVTRGRNYYAAASLYNKLPTESASAAPAQDSGELPSSFGELVFNAQVVVEYYIGAE